MILKKPLCLIIFLVLFSSLSWAKSSDILYLRAYVPSSIKLDLDVHTVNVLLSSKNNQFDIKRVIPQNKDYQVIELIVH